MAKIKKCSISYPHQGRMHHASPDMFYSSKYMFYIKLDSSVVSRLKHLDSIQLREMSVEGITRGAHAGTIIVSGGSETECENNFRNLLKYLASSSVEKEDIIIVVYQQDVKIDMWDNPLTYSEYPFDGLGFGFTRAKKVTTLTAQGEPFVTFEIDTSTVQGVKQMKPREQDLKRWIIIKDTDENYNFLKLLHERITSLKEKLGEFFKDDVTLAQAITSGLKLLN